jgi:hypothetical protein
MENVSPDHPAARWFHENTLVIRGRELILDQVPVEFSGGKKVYSASDGGFLIYRGRGSAEDGREFVSLRLFNSDYIAFPIGPSFCEPYSRVSIFPVKNIGENSLEINGVHYKRTRVRPEKLKFLLDQLSAEPFEYTGEHPYRKDSHAPPCKS